MAAVGDPPLQSRGPKERSASRLSEVGMILHRPGPLQTAKPPCRGPRAAPRSARWRGVPADAPPGALGGGTKRPACGVSFGAGWLAGARRRAGSRVVLGAPPFARRGAVPVTARGRHSDGVLYGVRFQIETPPWPASLFLAAAGNFRQCQCSTHKAFGSHQTAAAVLDRREVARLSVARCAITF